MSSNRRIRRGKAKSIRFRLTLFFVGFLALTLISFSTVLYQTVQRDQEVAFDAALYNYATDIGRSMDVTFFGTLRIEQEAILDREKIFPFGVGEAFLQVLGERGRILARSRSLGRVTLPVRAEDLVDVQRFQASFRNIRLNKTSYRMVAYPIEKQTTSKFILQVAVPRDMLEQQSKNLFAFFLFSIPLTLLAVAFGGFYLSDRVLAPVNLIIEKASRIGASKLSERVPVSEIDDELRDLSLTLNKLLDRLQQAFESQDRFVSDASHQLKTPLAILRGELDVLKSRSRSKEEYEEFCESAAQELKHLSTMVDNLLILARVDADLGTLRFDKVRMDEIAVEITSLLGKLAETRKIKIRLDLLNDGPEQNPADFEVQGDAELLRTMLQNLIENAIKFSDSEKTVEVHLKGGSSQLQIQVKNFGRHIPKDKQDLIFERFKRVENGSSTPPGLGIGLAIVRRIADAHHGTVNVESSEMLGTAFRVEIKKF